MASLTDLTLIIFGFVDSCYAFYFVQKYIFDDSEYCSFKLMYGFITSILIIYCLVVIYNLRCILLTVHITLVGLHIIEIVKLAVNGCDQKICTIIFNPEQCGLKLIYYALLHHLALLMVDHVVLLLIAFSIVPRHIIRIIVGIYQKFFLRIRIHEM